MLSEREQSYYAELFQTCDVDGTGKFLGPQVSELFRSSGLAQEILVQITELCGAKRLGHFGRSQFYIALKLIAVAQCGLPVTLDSINSGIEIPLPKFHKVHTDQAGGGGFQQQPQPVNAADTNTAAVAAATAAAAGDRQQQGQLPPPPTSAKKSHGRNLSGQFRGISVDTNPLAAHQQQGTHKEALKGDTMSPPFTGGQATHPPQSMTTSTGSPPTSPKSAPGVPRFASPTSPPAQGQPGYHGTSTVGQGGSRGQVGAPESSLAPADKQPPQRGTEEWARFESDDEKHGLLGNGKKEEWDGVKLPDFDSSSYSSDTESVEDVWSINEEQREYYVRQFQTIEPDINGHIMGTVAKEFFEKSKLSNHELSKIWNLADLNKDGALSLEEFCIAMHLVVLRRNEIEIPDRLPLSLMPYNAFINEDQEPFAADLPQGSTLKRLSPSSSQEVVGSGWDNIQAQESPQISSSEVSSPSVTPANFDFQKPEPSDPEAHIVQPKARRLSPEMLSEMSEPRPERGRAFSEPGPSSGDGSLHDPDPTHKQRAHTAHADSNHVDATSVALHGRPRPLVKKSSVPGALPGHILPPVPAAGQPDDKNLYPSMSVDGVEPPVPPPRPGQHGRSMSVDYKAPPAVPPRVSPKDPPSVKKMAQFKHFEPIQSQEALNTIPGHEGASSTIGNHEDGEMKTSTAAVAWDLLGEDFNDGSADRQAEFALAAQRQASRDKKELQMAIRTHKERNSTLSRLNSELNQELQEVMEQRIALEIQLEHLRPFSS